MVAHVDALYPFPEANLPLNPIYNFLSAVRCEDAAIGTKVELKYWFAWRYSGFLF